MITFLLQLFGALVIVAMAGLVSYVVYFQPKELGLLKSQEDRSSAIALLVIIWGTCLPVAIMLLLLP